MSSILASQGVAGLPLVLLDIELHGWIDFGVAELINRATSSSFCVASVTNGKAAKIFWRWLKASTLARSRIIPFRSAWSRSATSCFRRGRGDPK